MGSADGKESNSMAEVLEERAITPDAPPQFQVLATGICAGVDSREMRS